MLNVKVTNKIRSVVHGNSKPKDSNYRLPGTLLMSSSLNCTKNSLLGKYGFRRLHNLYLKLETVCW